MKCPGFRSLKLITALKKTKKKCHRLIWWITTNVLITSFMIFKISAIERFSKFSELGDRMFLATSVMSWQFNTCQVLTFSIAMPSHVCTWLIFFLHYPCTIFSLGGCMDKYQPYFFMHIFTGSFPEGVVPNRQYFSHSIKRGSKSLTHETSHNGSVEWDWSIYLLSSILRRSPHCIPIFLTTKQPG